MHSRYSVFLTVFLLVTLMISISSPPVLADWQSANTYVDGIDYVTAAWNIPEAIYSHGPDAIKPFVETALKVSEYSQYLIGTLSYSSQGGVTYSPTPTDRLRVIASNSVTTDYYVHYFQGDLTYGPAAFMRSNYLVMFREVSAEAELLVIARQVGRSAITQVSGTIKWEGASYSVKAVATSSFKFESDSSGMQYDTETSLSGTITGSNLLLSLNDKYTYTLASTSGFSASRLFRTVNSQWTTDGKSYAIRDGAFGRSFRNGKLARLSSEWNARGTIWEGNRSIGTITSQRIGNNIRIAARWTQGETILQNIVP